MPAAAPSSRPRLIAILAWIALALLFAEFTRHALKYTYPPTDQTKGDFLAFFEAAEAMRAGDDLYTVRHRNYIYPPFLALLYLPLTVFSDPATLHRTAGIIALLLNVAMAIAAILMFSKESLRRLGPLCPQPPPHDPANPARCLITFAHPLLPVVALIATLLIADKLRSELRMWQTNVLMLFFLALFLRLLDRRPALAGLFLGLAINIKYLPIFFLPWLLLRRRFAAAAGSLLGILLGAFSPALVVGWSKNLDYLHAGFAGLLGLFGVPPPPSASHAVMEDIAGGLSVSLTSAFARFLGGSSHAHAALAIGGCVAAIVAGVAAAMYFARKLPLLAWPATRDQLRAPFPALILLEFAAILIALLVFGPQTNPRHLCLLIIPAAAAGALIVLPFAAAIRLTALAGALLMVAALSLPPGGTGTLDHLVDEWRRISGASYGMLAMLLALTWTITAAAARLSPSSNTDAPACSDTPAAPSGG